MQKYQGFDGLLMYKKQGKGFYAALRFFIFVCILVAVIAYIKHQENKGTHYDEEDAIGNGFV